MAKNMSVIAFIALMHVVRASYPLPFQFAPMKQSEEELRKSLLDKYDKKTRPDKKTTININQIRIMNIDMHESIHSVDVYSWFLYSWNDTRLKWNPNNWKNITRLAMDPDEVWQPDLAMYNSAIGPSVPLKSQLPFVLQSSGKILFVPVYHLHFTCIMDLTYWPHDTHVCSMKLGSWVHSGDLLDLVVDDFKILIEIPLTDSGNGNLSRTEWNISATSYKRQEVRYPCCLEPYVDILITMLITRIAPAYSWTVKMPAACLSLLTLVMFLLPPGAGEKIIFGGLCLVLDFLFIDYTSYAINHAPNHTPLIVQLVCQQVVLLMLSLIVSAIVVRIARDPHYTGLPRFIKEPVVYLAYLLFLSNYGRLVNETTYGTCARTIKSDEVELGDDCDGDLRKRDKPERNEWLVLAAVIDRLFFILYLAICLISLIRFSSVL